MNEYEFTAVITVRSEQYSQARDDLKEALEEALGECSLGTEVTDIKIK